MMNLKANLFFLVALLCACSSQPGADTAETAALAERPIPVRLSPVARDPIQLSIKTAGQVVSQTEVKPAFKIGGVIGRSFAEEGDRIKKRQLLATLNLAEIGAQVRQATEAVDKASRDLTRAKNLFADSVATLEMVQNATTALRLAQEQLEVAKFNQQYAEIRSPIDGRVIKKLLQPGEIAGPGMPVFYILGDKQGDWVVRAGLADRDWSRLRPGDRASLQFDAWPGRAFPARVSQLADTGNPASGTFDVELQLLEQPPRLAAGLIAAVELFPGAIDGQTIVPLDALVEVNRSDAIVYTVSEGRAKALPVKLAFLHQERAVISAGLDKIELVVSTGASYLYEGAPVNVVE
jgi:RND family efflux transporter MFP subunit